MGASQVRLESVRRNSGGRIHLTPRVPRSGSVTTLCGQTLAAGAYAANDGEADCSICLRRSHDHGRVSGAFFAQEEGSELLRLSLEQARQRKPAGQGSRPSLHVVPPRPGRAQDSSQDNSKDNSQDRPVVWPSAKPPAEVIPDRLGELVTRGFKRAGEGVWRSPEGVVVHMRREGRQWLFAELVFEGSVLATRVAAGVRIRAGDVTVSPSADGVEVQVKR
jgi:hypothetical protein